MQGYFRPWGFQKFEAPRFRDSRHTKVVRLSAVSTGHLYPPGNIPGTHFRQTLSRPQGHSATGRIMSMKNSNDTVGNRIRDLPATTCPVCLYSDSCKNILKFGTPYMEHSVDHFTGIFTSATCYNYDVTSGYPCYTSWRKYFTRFTVILYEWSYNVSSKMTSCVEYIIELNGGLLARK